MRVFFLLILLLFLEVVAFLRDSVSFFQEIFNEQM